jgi:hypothetical protein
MAPPLFYSRLHLLTRAREWENSFARLPSAPAAAASVRRVLFAPAAVIYLGVIFILERSQARDQHELQRGSAGDGMNIMPRAASIKVGKSPQPPRITPAALTETAADLHVMNEHLDLLVSVNYEPPN